MMNKEIKEYIMLKLNHNMGNKISMARFRLLKHKIRRHDYGK